MFADWRRREYIRKRNILTSRSLSLKLPWASDYDVGGFSVSLYKHAAQIQPCAGPACVWWSSGVKAATLRLRDPRGSRRKQRLHSGSSSADCAAAERAQAHFHAPAVSRGAGYCFDQENSANSQVLGDQ